LLTPDLAWYISAMRKRLAIIAVLVPLAAIGILCAQSAPKQGVAKGSPGFDGKKETTSQNKDQDSQKPLSVVVQIEAPKSDADSAEHADDRQIQGKLALYTELLVIVGFLQFVALAGTLWIVHRQVKIMDRQTEIMNTHAGHLENLASAADASSKATTEIQTAIQKQAELMGKTLVLQFRPKVIIRVVQVKTSSVAPLMEQATGTVEIALVNIGQTHAKIFTAQFEAIAVDFGVSIGNTQVFENCKNSTFDLAGGAFENITIQLSGRVNDAIRWADDRHAGKVLGDASKGIYLVGSLAYVDDIGIKRQGGCFRNYDPSIKSFVPSKNSDREYVD